MKIEIMEHREYLKRTHDSLTVLLENGVTHIRVKPSRWTRDNHEDYAQIEIKYSIRKLQRKGRK